ncbi:MAG: hypothetical protein O3A01_09090, partial [bacterium]|nr:hypothetical protein [bacterium]
MALSRFGITTGSASVFRARDAGALAKKQSSPDQALKLPTNRLAVKDVGGNFGADKASWIQPQSPGIDCSNDDILSDNGAGYALGTNGRGAAYPTGQAAGMGGYSVTLCDQTASVDDRELAARQLMDVLLDHNENGALRLDNADLAAVSKMLLGKLDSGSTMALFEIELFSAISAFYLGSAVAGNVDCAELGDTQKMMMGTYLREMMQESDFDVSGTPYLIRFHASYTVALALQEGGLTDHLTETETEVFAYYNQKNDLQAKMSANLAVERVVKDGPELASDADMDTAVAGLKDVDMLSMDNVVGQPQQEVFRTILLTR